MKEIPLTQGYVAIVDDEDYEWLNQWKWHSRKGYGYRAEHFYKNGKRHSKSIAIHRLIMNVVNDNTVEIDHINGNPLDNRKANLRKCTHTQNCWNTRRTKRDNSPSKYIGIEKVGKNAWCVRLFVNGERIYIGSFSSEEEAAYAHDEAARKYHGEFAIVNGIANPNKKYLWGNKSNYRGVFYRKERSNWFAYIEVNRKRLWLGSFLTEREAALAYNEAAIKYRGNKAKLNVVD